MTAVIQVPRRGWWRRNIGWLVLLPVAAALTVGAWSFRVVHNWQYGEPVQRVDAAEVGGTARLTDETVDTFGLNGPEGATIEVALDARLLGVEPLRELPASMAGTLVALPPGTEAWRVDLEMSAEPGTPFDTCEVMLVTPDGTRYGEDSDPLEPNPCGPPAGPDGITPEAVAPKSGTWKASPVLLTREGEAFEQVLLTIGYPKYIALDVPR